MLKRLLKIVLLSYAIYVALIVVVITPLADHFLGSVYQQQTGRVLRYNGVGINPFNLSFYLYRAEDRNPSGSVLWAVDELGVNVSLASLFGKGIVLDELLVKSLYVHPQKNRDGSWVFDDILAYRAALEKNSAAEKISEQDDGKLPVLTIHRINFNASHMGYSDNARTEPFEAALEKINISLNEFSTVVEEGHPYHLLARDESGGELEWEGSLSFPGKYSEGKLQLRKISLLPVWRFIQSDVNFKMHSAFLDAQGDYAFSWADTENPEYKIQQGKIAFSNIDISPKSEHESGIALKALVINNINVDSKLRHVSSPLVELNQFRGTVSILESGVTNFQTMLSTPVEKTMVEKAAVEKNIKTTPTKNKTADPWQISIDAIHLNDAAFAFNDYSIKPNFKVKIQDFGGKISPFSSSVKTVTQVNLRGSVDGYAPVMLQGTVKPMAEPLDLKLAFDFRGIELSSFAPYSGTYAGYKIDSGLLSVSLDYTLVNNKVVGKNKIVINQLALGERVKSPRLIDLPLRLALALLTDEHGVIDLDVDVSGDTKNPDFSIGKIVLKALRNVIVKAVTAPFRLLANLIGGDGDFEYVVFETGQVELSASAKESLTKLQGALIKRPQLTLGVAGLYGDDDRHLFRARVLHEKFLAEGLSQKDIDSKNTRFYKKVESFYKKKWPEVNSDITAEKKYLDLVNAETNPELQLEQLGYDRAATVKNFLLQELKMDPAKVYLDKATQTDHKSAAKLLLNVK